MSRQSAAIWFQPASAESASAASRSPSRRTSSGARAHQKEPSRTSKPVGLRERRHAAREPVGLPGDERAPSGTGGRPEQARARGSRRSSSAVGASWPTIVAVVPRRSREGVRRARGPRSSPGPVHVERLGRRRAVRAGSAAHRVGVALPDHVGVAHRHVDRLAVAHLARDVVQHAVAQVDRVVEAEDQARRAARLGVPAQHALAAEAARRVVAGRRQERSSSVAPPEPTGRNG